MSKQSKITVKHYPNTNLKPQTDSGKAKYPLYVQVIFDRKIYKFKSENDYLKYVDDKDLEIDYIKNMLESEIKRVERSVYLLAKHNEKLLTSKDIYKYSKPLDKIIERNFGKLIELEFKNAPKTLTELSYSEINDLMIFLNGYDKISCSEKVSNVNQIIGNLDYFSLDFFNNDYCYIDFFYGNKYLEINNIFESTVSGNDDNHKKYLENFRFFLDL